MKLSFRTVNVGDGTSVDLLEGEEVMRIDFIETDCGDNGTWSEYRALIMRRQPDESQPTVV